MPIHDADADALARLRTPDSLEARALAVLTGVTITPDTSEAETLHTVFTAGLKLMEQKALEEAYRRQAEYEATHPDCTAWRRAMRNRRLRPFMDSQGHGA